MIVTKILGGLGNQLFQYAIGRSLSHKYSAELALDLTGLHDYYRPYYLGEFNINGRTLSEAEASQFSHYQTRISFSALLEKLKPMKIRTYRKEKEHMKFDPWVSDVPTDLTVYLDGFWQNLKYFEHLRPILLKEFTLKRGAKHPLFAKISSENSVSIHIRRGDIASKNLGTCSPQYYEYCIRQIAETIDRPIFYIFSDGIEWAQQNLHIPYPHFFVSEMKTMTDTQELIAISLCKHNIIANSTFSWWGAWLNDNPEKMVYTPKQWLASEESRPEGFLPADWKVIDLPLESK